MTAPLSRRERRQLEREQRSSGASHSQTLRRILLWGGALLVLAGVGWFMVRAARNVQLPQTPGALAVPVSSADHVIGVASASITLVEYGDFQCPACAAYHSLVKQLLADPVLTNKLRVVFRHFPLQQLHKNAQLASQAAEAASLQGKFWEMHDKLYTEQQRWAAMSSAGARSKFIEYATALGLDGGRFSSDIDSSAVQERVQSDVNGANQARVNATPTFFINGARMASPASYEEFRASVLAGEHANP